MTRAAIMDGMAIALWESAWVAVHGPGEQVPAVPKAAEHAAEQLEKLLLRAHCVEALQELTTRDDYPRGSDQRKQDHDFGYRLAKSAMGQRYHGRQIATDAKFNIELELARGELRWDGEVDIGLGGRASVQKRNPRFGKDDDVIAVTLDQEANAKTIAAEIRKRWKKAHASVQAKNGMFSVVLTNLLWDDDDDRGLAHEIRYWATDRAAELEGGTKRNPYIHNPHEWPKSEVQSLLFETSEFSVEQAKAWAKEHGYHYGKVDTTGRFHRLRQEAPQGGPCRTIPFTKGISAIVCSVGRGKPPGVG